MPHIYNCDWMIRNVKEPSFPILLSKLKAACDAKDNNKSHPKIKSVDDINRAGSIPESLRKVFVEKINRSIELHETVINEPEKNSPIDSPADQLLLNYFKMSLNEKMSSREMNNACINDWAKKEITPVTLPILLVNTKAKEGVMAQLTLWNTEKKSSPTSSAFIPAPSSYYMLLCEDTFLAGFNHVQTYIQGLLNEKPMPVIVWDLKPLSGILLTLEGLSASAAIAVGTLYEYPLVVDVDNDGQSEIVVINNSYAFGTKTGVTVYGDKDKSWRPGRKIWNQHAYYITNMVRLS